MCNHEWRNCNALNVKHNALEVLSKRVICIDMNNVIDRYTLSQTSTLFFLIFFLLVSKFRMSSRGLFVQILKFTVHTLLNKLGIYFVFLFFLVSTRTVISIPLTTLYTHRHLFRTALKSHSSGIDRKSTKTLRSRGSSSWVYIKFRGRYGRFFCFFSRKE